MYIQSKYEEVKRLAGAFQPMRSGRILKPVSMVRVSGIVFFRLPGDRWWSDRFNEHGTYPTSQRTQTCIALVKALSKLGLLAKDIADKHVADINAAVTKDNRAWRVSCIRRDAKLLGVVLTKAQQRRLSLAADGRTT